MQQLTSVANTQQKDARQLGEDISYVLRVLGRGWKLVAIGIVVCFAMAAVYVAIAKPEYSASAQLIVRQQGGQPLVVAGGGEPRGMQAANEMLETHLMIMRSPVVVGRALESAGLKRLSAGSVIEKLKVRRPNEAASVIELSYKADAVDEARRVLESVVESYQQFLRENYRQDAGAVISLIGQARDELSEDLKALEQQYLDSRRKNVGQAAEKGGRTFVSRRLDQWDQAANQAMTRALQLKMQLELAQRLAHEGADQDAITNAINQLAGVSGGGSAIGTPPPDAARDGTPSSPYEQVIVELSSVSGRRQTAELEIKNLRAEHAAAAASRPVDSSEVARHFYADPEVAGLMSDLSKAQAARDRIARGARQPSDPAVRRAEERVGDLQRELARLWQQRKPQIVQAMLGGDQAIRAAETNLITLKARESALREHAEQLRSERLAALRREKQDLATLHGPEHEKVAAVSGRIAKLEQARVDGHAPAESLVGSLQESLKSIEAMREEIQKRFREDLSASQVAEIASLEEENLLKNLERQRTLFDSVVAQLKQAQFTSSFQGVTAQVIQPPAVMPGRLNAVFIFALALVAGGTLGGGAAFMAELMDPRIRSMVDMRTMLDMPIFAVIPQLSPDQVRRSGGIEILSHRSPQSFLAESYRSARTSLECLRRSRRAHVLLVSSPNPGDGKTTTASNLAISLAHAGRRVLLVDGDLRKPSLHAVYNLDLDRGLTQVLGDRAPAQEVIQSTAVENLDLIAAGRAVPNPAELLASRRLGELFDEVRPLYEVVIVDSSPLLAVTDPSIISASADALLLVSRIGGSRRQDFERARELIETLEIPVVGAIVNGVTREQGGYGYGYPYGGTYSPAFTAEGLDRRIPPTGI